MGRTGPRLLVLSGHGDYVGAVAFSPDGTTLASGSRDTTVKLWDARSGHPLGTLEGHKYSVNSLAFSPDGQALASGAGQTFVLGEVRLWEARTGGLRRTLVAGCDFVDRVAFSPSGGDVAVATGSGCGPREPITPQVRLIDAATGGDRFTFPEQNCLAFGPDGGSFALGGPSSEVGLHDAGSGERTGTLGGHDGNLLGLAYSPCGRWLAGGGVRAGDGGQLGAVWLWDLPAGRMVSVLDAGGDTVTEVAFSPDRRLLAGGGPAGEIRLWEAGTGVLRAIIWEPSPPHWPRQFAFSPDGAVLAYGGEDGGVRLRLVDELVAEGPETSHPGG